MAKPVTIIGGGLAGLTLGIGLRQLGVPVVIHEAGTYPRHRVCGEFISGRGLTTLARLRLGELIGQAGAVSPQTVAFFTATKATAPRQLPSAAICISRFKLDAVLAKYFRELGGELRESQRFVGNSGEGVVRGTGRHAQARKKGVRWFGLKIHARNIALAADLEMHVSPRGYVGLCNINDGEVNVCGLFRKRADEHGDAKARHELLRGEPDSPLRQRLADATFDENSFCAVGGLSFRPRKAAARAEICVGDAITMIPPVTGNGMSMAFESAELAMVPLAAWSRDESSWDDARQQVARDCDAAFAGRLAWANWLQRIVLTPALHNLLVALAAHSDWFRRTVFERTR